MHWPDRRRRAIAGPNRLAWAQELMARHGSARMPARHVEQRLLARSVTSLLRQHWFAPHVQVAWHASIAVSRPRHASTSVTFITPPMARFTVTQPLTVRERSSHQTTERWNVVRHAIVDRLQMLTRHTMAMLLMPDGARERTRAASEPAVEYPAHRETERAIVTDRLLRHRRLEEQVTPAARVLRQQSLSVLSETPFAAAAAPPAPPRASYQDAGLSAAAPVPGFNITQITDQVVRQLDSRLIAARERFGNV
jgi:hypothetical protein